MGTKVLNVEELRKDSSGMKSTNSVFGEHITAKRVPAFNSLFAYPSDTRKLEATTENGGTVTQENYMLKVSTGTATNGKAIASSRRALQYYPGHEGYAQFTALFTTEKTLNRQMIGLFDDLNGFAIGMEGEEFSIFRKRDGVIVETVTQENFSEDKLDGSGINFIINPKFGNVYRIRFGFLGFAVISFEVLAEKKDNWIPFHIIDYPNKHEETHITLPYLKLRAEVENLGNDTDIVLRSGSVECGIVDGGGLNVSSRDFIEENSFLSFVSGTNQRLIVFHNKSTYGGIQNRVETLLNIVTCAVEANKPVTINRWKLASAPTGGTWTDKSVNSLMEISFDTIIDLTGAELTLSFSLSKADKLFEIVESLNKRMLPGDYIAYTLTTEGSGDLELGQGWKELF